MQQSTGAIRSALVGMGEEVPPSHSAGDSGEEQQRLRVCASVALRARACTSMAAQTCPSHTRIGSAQRRTCLPLSTMASTNPPETPIVCAGMWSYLSAWSRDAPVWYVCDRRRGSSRSLVRTDTGMLEAFSNASRRLHDVVEPH